MNTDRVLHFKKFFRKLLSFLVIFILVDMALGAIIGYFYFSQPNKYVYGIRETKADIIVVGSSRAENHYVPQVFKDSLGMTCFNMGSGGQNIYYDYAIISSILERYTPKIIIIDLMDIDYTITEDTYNTDKLSILLPFYASSKSVKEVLDLKGSSEKVKTLSQIYPYNSQISNILYSFVKKDNNPHLNKNGYIPIQGNIHSDVTGNDQHIFKGIDTLKIAYLKKIISLCKSKDVRLVLITSPWFNKPADNQQSDKFLQNVSTQLGVEYWNYSQHPIFLLNKTLFKDIGHLNDKGAVLYTRNIASNLRNVSNIN